MKKAKLYVDEDANLSVLDGQTIAFVGFGNQGRSQALNFRDTIHKKSLKTKIIVGNIDDKHKEKANKEGFEVYNIPEACKKAGIIFILLPDEVIPKVYAEYIEKNLKKGDVIDFASGFCITTRSVKPSEEIDVIMVAPRMGGKEVRELYESGEGFPSLFAVDRDASGNAKKIALALCSAIGSGMGKSSVSIEVTFEQETLTDLLTEQFLSPIIMAAWIAKYEVDIENGIPPEVALMELHVSGEWAEDFKRMAEMGIIKQLPLHSPTSQYGQLTRTDEVLNRDIGKSIKAYAQEKAKEIISGKFAKEWEEDRNKGYSLLKKMYKKFENSKMIKEEQQLLRRLLE